MLILLLHVMLILLMLTLLHVLPIPHITHTDTTCNANITYHSYHYNVPQALRNVLMPATDAATDDWGMGARVFLEFGT